MFMLSKLNEISFMQGVTQFGVTTMPHQQLTQTWCMHSLTVCLVTAEMAFALLHQHKQDAEDIAAVQAQAQNATQQASCNTCLS